MDDNLPGLSPSAFAKLQPFWWTMHFPHSKSDELSAHAIGSTAKWSVTRPAKQGGYEWRPVTYTEMLSLQKHLGGKPRVHDDSRSGYASRDSNDNDRAYVDSRQRRRHPIRTWCWDRWCDVLNALSPAG